MGWPIRRWLQLFFLPVYVLSIAALAQDTVRQSEEFEIGLTLTPFLPPEDPPLASGGVFVKVRSDCEAEFVEYSPSELRVISIHEGNVPILECGELMGQVAQPEFRVALAHDPSPTDRPQEGDPYVLTVEGISRLEGSIAGLRQSAPPIVASVIHEMLQIRKYLAKSELDDAYLRAGLIRNSRFQRLKAAGKVKFVQLGEFSNELQSVVSQAIKRPHHFHPFSDSEYRDFLQWASHGHDVFVISDETAYQITLYRGGE